MKNWYLTRQPNLIHKSCVVPDGVKIYLSEQQAKLHAGKIVETEPPDDVNNNVFVINDYSEYKCDLANQKIEQPASDEYLEIMREDVEDVRDAG